LLSLLFAKLMYLLTLSETGIAARNCRTRKRAYHFYSPGVVRRSHAAARHVRALLSYDRRCCWRCCV